MDEIVAIGGANMDITGASRQAVIDGDSNPGKISFSAGGVARNIAENLARLQTDVKLITSFGRDAFGKILMAECEEANIDVSHSYFPTEGVSTTCLVILNPDGDMRLSLSDMTALDALPTAHIQEKAALLERSWAIVADTNLPEEIIAYLLSHFGHKRIYMDPVSIGKAKKIKGLTGRFDTLKCNKIEAEFLSDMRLENREDYEKAGNYFLREGVKRLFISLGPGGVYYQSREERGIYSAPALRPVNVTGAGDAFMAGAVYSSLTGNTLGETVRFAAAMARIALLSPHAVSKEMTLERVKKEIKDMEGDCVESGKL